MTRGTPGPSGPSQQRVFVAYAFDSTRAALAAEQLLKAAGVDVRAIPKPLSFGGGCGIAVRLDPDDVALAEELLVRERVEWVANGEIVDY